MRQSWEDYEKATKKGPWSAFWKIAIPLFLVFMLISVVGFVCSGVSNYMNEAKNVAQEQLGARALLQKYEWFKDASAQLDKKQADIKVYNGRLAGIEKRYAGKEPSQWSRTDSEQYNLWLTESAGVIASYNALSADYNSQMSKINWRFCNVGQLPMGATVALPREYKQYIEGDGK
jgi:hypothetical protein